MKGLFVVLVVLALMTQSFADIGPGPTPPSLRVDLMKGGVLYTGEANVTYLCGTLRRPAPTMDTGDVQLYCTSGICTNSRWYYKFNPCFSSTGKLQVTAQGKTVTSGDITLANGGVYQYDLDIGTGALSQSGQPIPTPEWPCMPIGMLCLLAIFAQKKS